MNIVQNVQQCHLAENLNYNFIAIFLDNIKLSLKAVAKTK